MRPCYWYRNHQTTQPVKAVKIQAWWRRMLEVRAAKKPLRRIFEGDVTGLTGLRCLVLIGLDDEVLGIWTRAMIELGPEATLAQAMGERSTCWLVLMRKAALLLVLSLAYVPKSPNTSLYLDLLMVLLSNERAVAVSSAQGNGFCQAITAYLMKKQLYGLLRKSIIKLPIENSTSLPLLLILCTLPLSTYPENLPEFTQIYVDIFTRILSLPLLSKRLPPDRPSPFTSDFLLTNLHKLTPLIESISDHLSAFSSPDLAANVFMFISPHYERLSTQAFTSYLQLSITLFNRFNVYSLSPSSSPKSNGEAGFQTNALNHDSTRRDDETDYEDSQLEEDTCPLSLEVTIESLTCLEKIATPQHITYLINLTQSQAVLFPDLAAYLFTVIATWPSSQQEIQNVLLTHSSGRLVGDLYREIVRRSPLGQAGDLTNVYKSAIAKHWPPIILLADLYSQALQTMDDEEFFSKTPGSCGSNPLTLEEVVVFSMQLLRIVFSLYWLYSDYNHDDPEGIQYVHVSSDVYCSWKALREKLLRCLSRIHARDCRRPFVLLGHWLRTSPLDMNSFVDAAVFDEQRFSETFSKMRGGINHYHRKSITPCLSVLKKIPFAIPFEVRVSILQHLIVSDRVLHGFTEQLSALGEDQRWRVKVRRDVAAQDGFEMLGEVDLKAALEIVMTDQFEQEEEVIDGRGHFKEFFVSFCQRVLATHSGLWLKDKRGELYPITHAHAIEALTLDWYWFIGRMIGKAIYEGILVEVVFAYFFLSKWLERKSYIDDLFSVDPDLHRRLLSLKHSTENIENLSLYFTIATEESGVTKTVDLIPNGQNIAVTGENRLRYIDLSARYRLNVQIAEQSEAFLQGLSQFIQPRWLKMFNQRELQMLIGGTFAPVDLDDLRRHTTYGGIYHNDHETIVTFWRVVNSFHRWQKHSLLRFVTSCSRPHVLGFKELVPNFSIRDDGSDENRLPTSSVCVNLLKLPMYKSERQMREMLLEAVTFRAGFDSS